MTAGEGTGWHEFPLKVYLEDVDQGGIVYHANYLKYAERARTEWLLARGVSHAGVMESGAGIIVSRLEIRYLRPLRLEERLVVRTKINNIAPASAVLEQVFDRDGQTAAELVVELVFLGPNGKPARWPDSLLRALQQKEAE